MRKKTGFTLIEVMISVSIVAVIMTLIWQSSSQTFKAKDRTEARDMVFHMGRVALRKISDDIAVAFLVKQAGVSTGIDQAAAGTGQIKTFFIGEDQGAQDTLRFTSLAHLRLFQGSKESDQCKVQYEVVASQSEGGGYDLVRRLDPWLDNTTDVKGNAVVLVENIREFNVEYYNVRKKEWTKEWDSERVDWRGRLPFAVRIRISFPDPDDENAEIPLSTSVVLALSGNPIEM